MKGKDKVLQTKAPGDGDGKDILQKTAEQLLVASDSPSPKEDTAEYDYYQKKQKAKHERILHQRIQNHKLAQEQTKSHSQYKQMMKQRMNLPAFGYAKDICGILRDKRNQVVILTGDTGCG